MTSILDSGGHNDTWPPARASYGHLLLRIAMIMYGRGDDDCTLHHTIIQITTNNGRTEWRVEGRFLAVTAVLMMMMMMMVGNEDDNDGDNDDGLHIGGVIYCC